MDVFSDVSLVPIIVSRGLYLSRLVLPSMDDSLKLHVLRHCIAIIENFHLTLNNYCFFHTTVEYMKLMLHLLPEGANSGIQQ